jgi:F-type H+-transporting ATPase subunit delta
MHNPTSRYAKALLQLAVDRNLLGQIRADIVCFGQVCAANQPLTITLKSPAIPPKKKLAVLKEIFQNKIHALTLDFFALVIQRRREPLLPAIAEAFLTQDDQHQGIKRAKVTTTFALSDKLAQQVQEMVLQIAAPCKKVVLAQCIDPTLIGGYVLRVDGKRLDQSLRRKLLVFEKNYVTEGY